MAENRRATFRSEATGLWRFEDWAPAWVSAGVLDRQADVAHLTGYVPAGTCMVQADQVHGASIALVDRVSGVGAPLAGCDALLTARAGLALLIRTADCLPLFLVDASHGVVGLAHVGWRGIVAQLPQRLIAMARHAFHSRSGALRIAIGPCIRGCCYEVGPEFVQRFAPFIQRRDGRLYCDLVGAVVDQLRRAGVAWRHVTDSQRCTACEPDRWFSIRREGQGTGRLVSFIMVKPLG